MTSMTGRLMLRRAVLLPSNLSVSHLLASSPSRGASGEEAKRYGMPKPPLLGEVASSEAMMTERFNRQWVRDYPKTKLN